MQRIFWKCCFELYATCIVFLIQSQLFAGLEKFSSTEFLFTGIVVASIDHLILSSLPYNFAYFAHQEKKKNQKHIQT